MRSFLQATNHFVRSGNRFGTLDRISREWRYMNSDRIPERFLVELFPEVRGMKFDVSVDIGHHFELPYGERSVLGAIAHVVEPKTIFEFGTYSGSTTTLLFDACGAEAEVHTLDLPNDRLIEAGIDPKTIGHCIDRDDKYASKIKQYREDSRKFDFGSFAGRVDLVYIDASHEFDDVLNDSRNAIRMLSPKGVIVWDDYHTACMPVAEAIDAIAEEISVSRVSSTRLAVHQSG